jgi:hypothetical protein
MLQMYVVISGALHGLTNVDSPEGVMITTTTGSEPDLGGGGGDSGGLSVRSRRINAGDTVNILCALGIWNRCLESVQADVPVESYAVTEKDFESLFSAEADALTFEELKEREIHHYAFDEDDYEGAPTKWGRPLYYCCFTGLDVTLVRGRNIAPLDSAMCASFAQIEVVNTVTGKKLSRLWNFKTLTASKSASPFWGQRVEWQDILAPFDSLALRVTVFDSDDTCLGLFEAPLEDLIALTPGHEESPASDEEHSNGSSSPQAATFGLGGSNFSTEVSPEMAQRIREKIRKSAGGSSGSSLRGLQQREEQLEALQPGHAERWWDLKPPPSGRKSPLASSSGAKTRSLRRQGSSIRKTMSIQLRTRVRRPDRDPLPPPVSFV